VTASTIATTQPASHQGIWTRSTLGFRSLIAKDLAEWAHGPRAWVVFAVTTLFMVLSAANSWINAWILANLPTAETGGQPISMVPLDNVMAAVSSQIFVVAAIFASMSLLVAERDHGTLAWVASKPVARGGIWISKAVSASLVVWLVAVVAPMAVVTAVVTVLYGVPPILPIVAVILGAGAAVAFFVAVVLAASTVVASQPAVAAIGLAVMFLPTIIGGLLPFSIDPYLPTSILAWAAALAGGADAGVATPIVWAVSIVALAAFAAWRMERLEL
jgi:ABC-2 type transport system permease protein